jgi:hypothetical protein
MISRITFSTNDIESFDILNFTINYIDTGAEI